MIDIDGYNFFGTDRFIKCGGVRNVKEIFFLLTFLVLIALKLKDL